MQPAAPPIDLPSFLARFGSDEQCREHLFGLRWPDGFVCAGCGGRRCYRLATRLAYECTACRRQHSLLAGTIFEQTKTPISKWFLAIYLFLASKGGVSALELKRHLGFASDQTAWTWLHKLRAAMAVRGGPLEVPVEIGATFLAPSEPGKAGRCAGKTPVAGAVEVRRAPVDAPDPALLSGAARARAEAMAARLAAAGGELRRRLDRARLSCMTQVSSSELDRFVAAVVAPGEHGVPAGTDAREAGHSRKRQRLVGCGEVREQQPAVHLVFELLKRLLVGTYHGGIGRHLPAYLDEFVFRFDRKRSSGATRALAVVARAMATAPLRNRMILPRG